MDERLERVIRRQLREAGRQFEEARRGYGGDEDGAPADDETTTASEAGGAAATGEEASFELPTTEDGDARIVCRRYAEKRAVTVDDAGHPACFDPTHPDCEGCVEDIKQGVVETWTE